MKLHGRYTSFRFLTLATLILALGALYGCGQSGKPLQRAQKYERAGKHRSAMIVLKNLLQKQPKNKRAWLALGRVSLQMSQSSDAVFEFGRAKKLGVTPAKVALPLGTALLAQHKYQAVLDTVDASRFNVAKRKARAMALRGNAYLGLKKLGLASAAFQEALDLNKTLPAARQGLMRLAQARRQTSSAPSSSAGKPKVSRQVVQKLKAAKALIMQRKFDAAIKRLQGLPESGPAHDYAARMLVAAYLGKHENKKAIAQAKKILAGHPGDAQAHDLMGGVLMAVGEGVKAKTQFQQALKTLPGDATALMNLGTLALARHDPAAAKKRYKQVLDARPHDPAAMLRLAQLAAKAGHAKQALDWLKRASSENPKRIEPKLMLAQYYTAEKQFDKARQTMEKAAKLAPDQPEMTNAVGVAELADGRSKKALATFEHAVKAEPKNARYVYNLGRTYAALGNDEKARRQFENALDLKPDAIAVRLALADVYLHDHKTDASIEQYEKVIKAQPKNAAALNNVAWLYYQKGDARAVKMARKAAALAPDSAEVNDTLGWILVNKGELAEGREQLKHAAKLAPDNPSIGYHLAFALSKSGETAKAQKELAVVLKAKTPFDEQDEAEALAQKLH
jgi:Tfp pilus assembly protein PilF